MNIQKPNGEGGGGIEWTRVWGRPGATVNPLTGCEHGCRWQRPNGTLEICYAKGIALRLAKTPAGAAYQKGFETVLFHPEKLREIRRLKRPHGIFIDSMSDLFGKAVPHETIAAVIKTMRECPQHIFFSLTKNPWRLKEFQTAEFLPWPANWWVGISAPPDEMNGKTLGLKQKLAWMGKALEALRQCKSCFAWLSLEPLTFDMSALLEQYYSDFEWVVIGAMSSGAQPDAEILGNVLTALEMKPVFFKGNLDRTLALSAAGTWRQEFPDEEKFYQFTGLKRPNDKANVRLTAGENV